MTKHSELAKEMAEAMKSNHFLNAVAVSVNGKIAFELLTLIDEKLSYIRDGFWKIAFWVTLVSFFMVTFSATLKIDTERDKRIELETQLDNLAYQLESELFATKRLLFLCESEMQELYNVPGLGNQIDSILGNKPAGIGKDSGR